MEIRDNYKLQAQQAKQAFLRHDQEKLIQKLGLKADDAYLYTRLFSSPYRICRTTGDLQRWEKGDWVDANTHSEVMTLMDLVCDSREDRRLSFRWRDMVSFGHMFHRQLQEQDPWAQRFEADPEGLHRACRALGGVPFEKGDVAYTIEVFDGLCLVVQLWLGDEEFPANLRLLWDENSLMYLKYETMYFAKNLLLQKLTENMK